jgi:hypothetical protein
MRLPRITRTAPETNVSAATPEAGLISGTFEPPAKANVDRPITIPTHFMTDLLDGRFLGEQCGRIHQSQQYGMPQKYWQCIPRRMYVLELNHFVLEVPACMSTFESSRA